MIDEGDVAMNQEIGRTGCANERGLPDGVPARLAWLASRPDVCRELLDTHLRACRAGTRIEDVQVGDAWAGRRGKAFLRLDAALRNGAGTRRTMTFIVELFSDGDARKVLWRLRRRHPGEALRAFAACVRDQRLLIHPLGFDYRLSTLPLAFAPAELRTRRALADHVLTDDPPQVVRYVPEKRCLLRYRAVDLQGVEQFVLGKVHARGEDMVSAGRQRAVAGALAAHPTTKAPKVLGICRQARIVFQEQVGGMSVYDHIRQGTATRAHGSLSGTGLRALHATNLKDLPIHDVVAELVLLDRAISRSFLKSDEQQQAVLVLAALARTAPTITNADFVVSHRDFYDKQVLVSGTMVNLIDFDTLCVSWPEIDVGNYLAHLRLRQHQGYCTQAQANAQGAAFLDGYAHGDDVLDEDRICWALSATSLRLACVYSARPAWTHLAASLLDEASARVRGHSVRAGML